MKLSSPRIMSPSNAKIWRSGHICEVQSLDERCQLQPTSHPSFQQSKDNKICFDDYTMKSPKQLSTIEYLSKGKNPIQTSQRWLQNSNGAVYCNKNRKHSIFSQSPVPVASRNRFTASLNGP